MNKGLTTITGTTLLSGIVGSVLGAPVPEVLTAAVTSGTVSAGIYHMASNSRLITTRDMAIAMLPSVGSALATGLTHGWDTAVIGFLTGPLASLLRAAVEPRESAYY